MEVWDKPQENNGIKKTIRQHMCGRAGVKGLTGAGEQTCCG